MNLELLYKLQSAEKKQKSMVDQIDKAKNSTELRTIKGEHDRLKKILVENEKKISENEKQQKKLNHQLVEIEHELKTSESQKYSEQTDNMKKLGNIETYITQQKERLFTIEEQILKFIDEIEVIEENNKETKKKMNFMKNKFGKLKIEAETVTKKLAEQVKMVDTDILKMKKQLDPETDYNYTILRKRYDTPISLVIEKKCSECGVDIPSMRLEETKLANSLVRCENCNRILYYRV